LKRKRYTKRAEKIEVPVARTNKEIDAKEVRLLKEDNSQYGVIAVQEALKMAEEAELDLVEIFAKANPPVCKIMNYSKYVFDTTKKKIQARKNVKQAEQKTIKLRPNTSEGDYEIKKRKIFEFLEKGHRIKIIVWFKGREITHQELGMEMLNKVKADLEEYVRIDDEPKLEGRQVMMAIAPLANKKPNTKKENTENIENEQNA
jgi:translation initiation factor IF-3